MNIDSRALPTRDNRPARGPADRARRAGRRPALRAADRAGDQALRRRHGADAGLQRLDPRADAEGPRGLGDRSSTSSTRATWSRPCTGTGCAWTTAPTARTRPRRRSRSAAASPAASTFPDPGRLLVPPAHPRGLRPGDGPVRQRDRRARPTPTTGRRRTASCAHARRRPARGRPDRAVQPLARRPTRRWAASATCC